MGWLDGGLYLTSRIVAKVSGGHANIVKYYLTAQPIGRFVDKPMRHDQATVLCKVAKGDPLVAVFPRPPGVLERRFKAGAVCTAAIVQGKFAGFIWVQRNRYEEDEVRCTYVLEEPVSSIWDFDVYVEPRFRIGRTMARLWTHVESELAAEGVRWSFSRISAFNPASLASHARLGAARLTSVLFFTFGRLQVALLPQRPFVHISLSQRQAPVLRMRPPN